MRRLALLVFILLALLSISLSQSQGLGTNANYLIRHGHRLQPNKPLPLHHQENMKIRREMREYEISDYDDPKANVNPRSEPLLNPPNPTPPPSH